MAERRASDLTVIIPTRDRNAILTRTVDALSRQTVRGFEVVVVVDGTDQTPPELPGVTTLVKEHGGPGAARNAGVVRAKTPLILFLGDDMIPEPDLVERHLARHAASTGETSVVLGHVDWHPEAGRNRILRWFDWSSSQFDYRGIAAGGIGWGHFYSCNVSLKRSFFLGAGGFDEDFTFYYEDLDMARRLHDRGMTLHYEPHARARHLHRYSLEQVISRYEGVARGEHMMAAKHSWFAPFFGERVRQAEWHKPISRLWPLVVDLIPRGAGRLRRGAERRANDWYYQQIAPRFHRGWRGARELAELREYLGSEFDPASFRGHVAAVDLEEEQAPDEKTFYRTSRMYLYDLTVFAMSGTKEPYLRDLTEAVPAGARLLDWGCGIGSDGLELTERGYRVSFADFDNPSTAYLRWRLAHRGIQADVYDIESPGIPTDFDAVYSFDVIEHVEDPFAFLAELESRAAVVAVNFLEPSPDDTHLHKPLPISELVEHARKRGLIRYRTYHGRSHFVIYRARDTAPSVPRR